MGKASVASPAAGHMKGLHYNHPDAPLVKTKASAESANKYVSPHMTVLLSTDLMVRLRSGFCSFIINSFKSIYVKGFASVTLYKC